MHNLYVTTNDQVAEGKLAKRVECKCGYEGVWVADIGEEPFDVDEAMLATIEGLKLSGHDNPPEGPSETEQLKTKLAQLEAKLDAVLMGDA